MQILENRADLQKYIELTSRAKVHPAVLVFNFFVIIIDNMSWKRQLAKNTPELEEMDVIWAKLHSSAEEGFLMGAACGDDADDDDEYDAVGLASKHAYSLLEAKLESLGGECTVRWAGKDSIYSDVVLSMDAQFCKNKPLTVVRWFEENLSITVFFLT